MGVADHRLSVSEAGYVEVQFGAAAKRRGCLGVSEVEDAENHLSFVFRGDVPGDENPLLGKVQRDAAVGMAGSGNDMPATSARMVGASMMCATTSTAPHELTSAAEPTWSSWKWVRTTRSRSDRARPICRSASAMACPIPPRRYRSG